MNQFFRWGVWAFFAATAFTFFLTDNILIVLGCWVGTLICACGYAMTIPFLPVRVTSDESRQLPEVAVPHREWRYRETERGTSCAGCGRPLSRGGWSPWLYDERFGLFTKTKDHFCVDCKDLREQAEHLGETGVREKWIEGDLSTERRDEMLDYLVREEQFRDRS